MIPSTVSESGPITIVGVGGVGSRVAEGLVRMGCGTKESPITLIDNDRFEAKNLINQFVTGSSIGKKKVFAVADDLCRINPDLYIDAHDLYIEGHFPLSGVVFLCLDSMLSRKRIMETCLENNPNVSCVIETRMDAEAARLFCFDPCNDKHQDCWWLNWHPDNESENTTGCNGKIPVISAVFGTAALALKRFERYMEKSTAIGITNKVYLDFLLNIMKSETWPS
jgi:molybdopterin/thiamine biosynthesis adenylyltransferase